MGPTNCHPPYCAGRHTYRDPVDMEPVGAEHLPPRCENNACAEFTAFMHQRNVDWLVRVEEAEKELELMRARNNDLLAELAERENAEERCADLERQLSLERVRNDEAWRTFAEHEKNAKRHAELEERCSELELKLFITQGHYTAACEEITERENAKERYANLERQLSLERVRHDEAWRKCAEREIAEEQMQKEHAAQVEQMQKKHDAAILERDRVIAELRNQLGVAARAAVAWRR